MEVAKLLYSRKEAAFALSLSVRSLDYLMESGAIATRKIGSRVLVPVEEINRIAAKGVDGPVAEAA